MGIKNNREALLLAHKLAITAPDEDSFYKVAPMIEDLSRTINKKEIKEIIFEAIAKYAKMEICNSQSATSWLDINLMPQISPDYQRLISQWA